MMRPSRFLKEIPESFLQSYHHSSVQREADTISYGAQEEEAYEPGDTVFHKDFGTGIVQKSYRTSLDLTYDVFFPQTNATRSLVAKFARLTTIDKQKN